MNKNDDEKETERHDKNAPPTIIDALLEVPDPRLLTGDLLFILIINFLLQIGAEVGSPNEEQRNAAILLGFTQDMWDYGGQPDVANEWWDQMTTEEENAAALLGWDKKSWDEDTDTDGRK